MVDIQFNAEEFEPAADFEPLPAGWYQAMAVESNMVPNKSGTGDRLNFQFQILKPEQYANRRVFLGLNIRHENAMAQEIAQKELSSFCRAAKKMNMSNTEDLHGTPVHVKLRIDPGNEQFEARNEIRMFKPIDEEVTLVGLESEKQPPGWAVKPAGETAKQPKRVEEPPSEPVPDVSEEPPW